MPFQIVEKPGFLHLMKKAVPQYKVPRRSYFSTNKIPAMYKEVQASVEEQLAEGVWFGVTTDLWTSHGGGGEPFMSFTVHYLSTDWKLKTHCLETLYFPEDHTAEHITEMIENMLLDWKIKKENLSGITTDNASNMKKALALFPFLEQQQAICGVLVGDRSTWYLMPKDTDITVLEKLSQLLCPLHDVTDVLASEKQVTLSCLNPVLEHINNEILQDQEEDCALTKQMKAVIREDLLMQLRYTEEMKNVLNISRFGNPRFKGSFAENLDDTVKACSDEAMALASHPDTEDPLASTTQSSVRTSSTTTKKRLSGLLQQITSAKKNRSQASAHEMPSIQERIDSEIKLYVSLPAISADSDPLSWWKAHVEEISMLSKVARKYLCIPATSVPSETVFSASGHILSPHRSRLSTENVNMLTFLHYNMN
ncbi:E3 SUMO-protein ligase ZBED1 [Labeo rohita]|uniref:E3 SUMO-protein ligase ZBED1 n=1 Tax=Labeo rohita TaxID=84645 RepID=A0ABQ8LEL0_LABRO|nr:E3 SUMO-protein ligase ZBED1 [Labeo rohita]